MNKYKIYIDDTEYSEYFKYPLSITRKTLEESLTMGNFTLAGMEKNRPFSPHRRLKIDWFEDDNLHESLFLLLLNDKATKNGSLEEYDHQLTFIEYTYVLSLLPLRNTAITRITGEYEPSLWDTFRRIIEATFEYRNYAIFWSPELKQRLENIDSPEFTFVNVNALEALRMVFMMARIVPKASFEGSDLVISFAEVGEKVEDIIDGFSIKSEAYDPQTYRTALFSDVSNLVVNNENPIVEPANGWKVPSASDDLVIEADSVEFATKYPIYKMNYIVPKTNVWVRTSTDELPNIIRHLSLSVPFEWLDIEKTKEYIGEKNY